MDDEDPEWNQPGDLQRGFSLQNRLLAPGGIADGVRVGRRPVITRAEPVRDRRMDAVQRQPGVSQPFPERSDRAFVAVVEVAARREQLDALEPVRSNLREMVPVELLVVIEVCGNAEMHARGSYDEPLIIPAAAQFPVSRSQFPVQKPGESRGGTGKW
jgi:hypothetical protein